jgi:hypothetical protein
MPSKSRARRSSQPRRDTPRGTAPSAPKAPAAPKPAAASPVVTRTNAPGPRQIRDLRRAEERRRRAAILGAVAAVVVVGLMGWLLLSRLTSASGAAKVGGAASCPATPTVVGPAPSAVPPATPPPVSGKAIQGAQGLQYIDVKVGCGPAVKAGDNVTVNYTGWLASDGKMFDSSLQSGRTPFQVMNVGQAQVIAGWNIGLIGMKPGGTRRLIIPGYGAQGYPPTIPPNSTLIFDITLVSIDS